MKFSKTRSLRWEEIFQSTSSEIFDLVWMFLIFPSAVFRGCTVKGGGYKQNGGWYNITQLVKSICTFNFKVLKRRKVTLIFVINDEREKYFELDIDTTKLRESKFAPQQNKHIWEDLKSFSSQGRGSSSSITIISPTLGIPLSSTSKIEDSF